MNHWFQRLQDFVLISRSSPSICLKLLSTFPFWPVYFFRHSSPNSRTFADRSGRTEWLWSMSRTVPSRTSSENLWVPFKNWLPQTLCIICIICGSLYLWSRSRNFGAVIYSCSPFCLPDEILFKSNSVVAIVDKIQSWFWYRSCEKIDVRKSEWNEKVNYIWSHPGWLSYKMCDYTSIMLLQLRCQRSQFGSLHVLQNKGWGVDIHV